MSAIIHTDPPRSLTDQLFLSYKFHVGQGKPDQEALQAAFNDVGLTPVDPNYSEHVGVVSDPLGGGLYWVKRRSSPEEAKREVDALLRMADVNGASFRDYFSIPPSPLGRFLIVPDVGPDLEEAYQALNNAIDKNERGNLEDMLDLRWELACRHMDMLAHTMHEGVELVGSAPNPADAYKANFVKALRLTKAYDPGDNDVLIAAVSLFSTLLDRRKVVPYVDSVARNMALHVQRKPGDFSADWLPDLLSSRRGFIDDASTDVSTAAQSFLKGRLFQIDLHRGEKNQLDGECAWNVADCAVLAGSSDHPMTMNERETLFARYLLTQMYFKEPKGNKSTIRDLLEAITGTGTRTREGRVNLDTLKGDLFGYADMEYLHHLGMRAYRDSRTIWYGAHPACSTSKGGYIVRYREALISGPDLQKIIAEYRLPMAERDIRVHTNNVLHALDELREGVYNALYEHAGRPNIRKISVESDKRGYTVTHMGGNYFFYNGKSAKRDKRMKPGNRDNKIFNNTVKSFGKGFGDDFTRTDKQTMFGQLLALTYIKHLVASGFKY